MVRQWQEFFYERNYEATPLLNPNFVKLAEAYGIRSMAVTRALAGAADRTGRTRTRRRRAD